MLIVQLLPEVRLQCHQGHGSVPVLVLLPLPVALEHLRLLIVLIKRLFLIREISIKSSIKSSISEELSPHFKVII